MEMSFYLSEVEFAVTETLAAVWHEHDELAKMHKELGEIFERVVPRVQGHPSPPLNQEDNRNIEILLRKSDEIDFLKKKLRAREFAVSSLSGALLQIARQGISIVHGGFDSCPAGRLIGSQPLIEVIWEARNQAFHWEEGRPRLAVRRCFRKLALEFGLMKFGTVRSGSCAFNVVELLNWRTFGDFKADLLLLE